jgi:hypothetical protein
MENKKRIIEKINLIDEIVKLHPSYGVKKGWSWYVGGMRDDGGWYFRKMLDVTLEELQSFLDTILAENNQPPRVYTEEELSKIGIIHKTEGGWMNEYEKEQTESFAKERERKILGL